ncbi:hypothetical protein PGT21_019298 [Puccinia graminis f. sp. tritici]|uniref:Uncharacterized protein n=1 Tax=Puccinia graminis f. sp. tritici TaxID=56615 RepID=A0A5B0LY27_PUCGR|nr:hypothetical protein PGTUg99_033588 [Puccinia graminis f. sp. tritici]KAA1104322.1 hypothetical protein PGT21_019298 [Puccinia graminis f. sp. tritici]
MFLKKRILLLVGASSLISPTALTGIRKPAVQEPQELIGLGGSSEDDLPMKDIPPRLQIAYSQPLHSGSKRQFSLVQSPSLFSCPKSKSDDLKPSSSRQDKYVSSRKGSLAKRPKYNEGDPRMLIEIQDHSPRETSFSESEKLLSNHEMMVKISKRPRDTPTDAPDAKGIDRDEKETEKLLPTLLRVYDWNFVRMRQGNEISNCQEVMPNQNLANVFKHFKFRKNEKFHWIARADLVKVVAAYRKQRYLFYTKVESRIRNEILSEIVLNLANENLALDSNPTLTSLLGNFKNKIESRTQSIDPGEESNGLSPSRIATIMEYLENVNKIATFLIIIHLSIFKEHPVGELKNFEDKRMTQAELDKILDVINNAWMEIIKLSDQFLKNDWAEKNSHLFKDGSDLNETRIRNLLYRKDIWYHMAWNIVEYWAKETDKVVKWNGQKPTCDQKPLVEIVNYIIIYSNYEYFSRKKSGRKIL